MLKILLKAAVLFLIVISVYIIVNPTACSNMLAGRERTDQMPSATDQDNSSFREQPSDMRKPTRTTQDGSEEMFEPADGPVQGIIDTNTLQENQHQQAYSQQDIDYAIASRYVELEREYANNHAVGKDTSREISFIVMDDFEMSPAEWESFLSRATATGLFEKVRKELPRSDFPTSK